MSKADDLFIAMCKDIIENGYDTKGEKVRPKWEDGTSAYTIKRFGVVNRYNLGRNFRRSRFEKLISNPQLMNCSGSGRKNQITSMTCTAISGTRGQTKMVRSARRMVTSSV